MPEDKNQKAPAEKIPDKKLGQILLELGSISELQLAQAIATQSQINASSQRKFKIGEVLLFKKVITMQQLHEALRAQTTKAAAIRRDIKAIKKKADLIKSLSDQDGGPLGSNEKEDKPEGQRTFLSFLQPKKSKT